MKKKFSKEKTQMQFYAFYLICKLVVNIFMINESFSNDGRDLQSSWSDAGLDLK
jgi:hypothetical protein